MTNAFRQDLLLPEENQLSFELVTFIFPPEFCIFSTAFLEACSTSISYLFFTFPLLNNLLYPISFKFIFIVSFSFFKIPFLSQSYNFVSIVCIVIGFIIFLLTELKPLFPKYEFPYSLRIVGFFWSALFPEPAIPLPPLFPAPLLFFLEPPPCVWDPLYLDAFFLFIIIL